MDYISSFQNSVYKELTSLKEKKFRIEKKEFLIEGLRFVNEAIVSKFDIKYIILNETKRQEILEKLEYSNDSYKVIILSSELFNKLSETHNSQGIMACMYMKDISKDFNFNNGIYFLIDKIQDPGNLGTIIRTAVAVNALGVIILKGTVDLYNNKVLRSTMGAIFNMNIYLVNDYLDIISLTNNGFRLLISDICEGNAYYNENLRHKVIVAVGNEANGFSAGINQVNYSKIHIPMFNNLESLNVAQALSIIAFDYLRQTST